MKENFNGTIVSFVKLAPSSFAAVKNEWCCISYLWANKGIKNNVLGIFI